MQLQVIPGKTGQPIPTVSMQVVSLTITKHFIIWEVPRQLINLRPKPLNGHWHRYLAV